MPTSQRSIHGSKAVILAQWGTLEATNNVTNKTGPQMIQFITLPGMLFAYAQETSSFKSENGSEDMQWVYVGLKCPNFNDVQVSIWTAELKI